MLFVCVQVSARQRKTGQRRATTSVRKTNQDIIKTRQVGDDGFIWYKLYKDNKYGAADVEGNIIIPIKYSGIYYKTSDVTEAHYFYVRSGDFSGVYTRLGKCIISPDKHFTFISFERVEADNDGPLLLYFEVKNDLGERGLYDAKGNEVIAPAYETIVCASVFSKKPHSVGVRMIKGKDIINIITRIIHILCFLIELGILFFII